MWKNVSPGMKVPQTGHCGSSTVYDLVPRAMFLMFTGTASQSRLTCVKQLLQNANNFTAEFFYLPRHNRAEGVGHPAMI